METLQPLKEGVIKEVTECFKYSDDLPTKKVPITCKEYNEIIKEHGPVTNPYDTPNAYCKTYKEIRLSMDTIYAITGVLSYDMALNEFAVKYGYHPASGFKACQSHINNIKWRKKYIALFGLEPHDVGEDMFTKRCEKCKKR